MILPIIVSALAYILTMLIIDKKVFNSEKYKLQKDLGDFPLQHHARIISIIDNEDSDNKYSGHRSRHGRRYNFLSRKSLRSFE